MGRFLEYMQEPEVVGCSVDDSARLAAHRTVLQRKLMIRDVFDEFHRTFANLDDQYLSGHGLVIELGAGVYPVRETIPGVVATDVVPAAHLDCVIDAGKMDLGSSSVRSFYLQNVFHHFPSPGKFFEELQRTLVPGGGAILIEPAAGPFAGWLYPRLFASETYDKNAKDWEASVRGPMSGANQALSHIVFDRDLGRFENNYPGLEVVYRGVLGNWLRYLLSGGLNFKALFPESGIWFLKTVERVFFPLRGVFGLHRVIVIRKRSNKS